MGWVVLVVATAAAGLGAIRWLRVAQREHYLAGSVTAFARRWWSADSVNLIMWLTMAIAALLAMFSPTRWWLAIVALGTAAGPLGLGLKGTSSPLAWTARLKRTAGILGVVWLIVGVPAAVVWDGRGVGLALIGLPVLVDLALAIAWPLEVRSGTRWVDQARRTLDQVQPTVVAITGSYGKTTTKEYVRRLLAPHRQTVASPASFNNRMGLARAINEHLVPGTDVFIAEMGTYGPGEIADLCSWIPPKVGVITAIGPVHLERFGSLDAIVTAKREILEGVDVAVLNVDDERLERLVGDVRAPRVIRCSVQNPDADVRLTPAGGGWEISVDGEPVATVGPVPLPTNLACAVGVAVGLGIPLDGAAGSLAEVTTPAHRQRILTSDAGFVIVDDTYNSNPAGAASALATLARLGSGRRVVVTPGMVELGEEQVAANREFGQQAGDLADTVVIVGRTNRRALTEGVAQTQASVIVVGSRPEAVEWVKSSLGPGDAVLYENDLPDHYP